MKTIKEVEANGDVAINKNLFYFGQSCPRSISVVHTCLIILKSLPDNKILLINKTFMKLLLGRTSLTHFRESG